MPKRNDYKHILGGVAKIPSTSAYETEALGLVSAQISSTADFLTKIGAPKSFIDKMMDSNAIVVAGSENDTPQKMALAPVIPLQRGQQPANPTLTPGG